MKRRNPMLRGLRVIMLLCSLLPSTPAQAQFTQQGPKLVATDAVGPASQGWSVSLSGDGNTAIVGGFEDNFQAAAGGSAGAAWVYTRAGGAWGEQAKLVGTGAIGPAFQGISVSLSSDGNTAIVGGYGDNFQTAISPGTASGYAGAAWVYTRDRRAEKGEAWSQQAKLVGIGALGPAEQGSSVSLSGDGNTAIVGGAFDNDTAGAAWVYTRSRGVWSQQAKLVGTGAIGRAVQGASVSLSGDGNTAIVGGTGDNGGVPNGVGAAWVYTRSRGVWSQQAKLVGVGAVGPALQGASVSLSGDGNTAIVGGPYDNGGVLGGLGAAWVYSRNRHAEEGEAWSQQAKLVGTGALGSALQGWSVSLSGDGNTAVVGGRNDNGEVGAAWVYTRDRHAKKGEAWSQQAKLVGAGAIGRAVEGFSVSLSGNGHIAMVGGPSDNSGAGAAWVYAEPIFAGTPGKANCYGQSVSALARQFGGLNAAAAALGYSSVQVLQNDIAAYCAG